MSKLLIVVDMQKDFVTGPLGTKEAEAIVPKLADFIQRFDGTRIYTLDTHTSNYLETQEGQLLPIPHCMEGYPGHDLVPEINQLVTKQDMVLTKPGFGSPKLFEYLSSHHFDDIYLAGVCTGICVISNAVLCKTADTESCIHILSDLCACVSPESHRTALAAMERLQMDITTGRDCL